MTGKRRMHTFETVSSTSQTQFISSFGKSNKMDTERENSVRQDIHVSIWQEHYDDSAQARYWFNSETNEATWINPFS